MASLTMASMALPMRAVRPSSQANRSRVAMASPKARVAPSMSMLAPKGPVGLRSSFAPSLPVRATVAVKRVAKAKPTTVCEAAAADGPLAKIVEKYPWAETAFYFGLWYMLNVQFNIINKQIYNYFPYPAFVSCVHLAVGLVIAAFFWGTKLVKYQKPSNSFLKGALFVAMFHGVGHVVTNVSFATVAVSFTHTIKTLEPVFSSIISFLVTGTVYSPVIYASLLPIMGGVALCSATELSFTWVGFITAMMSNLLFASRAVFSKKLMTPKEGEEKMNPINVYNWVSIISLFICIPFVFALEWSTLGSAMTAAAAKVGQEKFYWDLWNVGMYYHLYNQVAYQALGKVDPVTHAVGNVGKRIFVIGFSILAFGNKLTTQSIVGSAVAIAGAGLYGYLKGKEAEKK
jgi:solute carrier family 35 protein E1